MQASMSEQVLNLERQRVRLVILCLMHKAEYNCLLVGSKSLQTPNVYLKIFALSKLKLQEN